MNKTNNSPVTRAAVTEKYRKSYSVRTAANEAKVLRVRVGKESWLPPDRKSNSFVFSLLTFNGKI